jgi:hypothetical protein
LARLLIVGCSLATDVATCLAVNATTGALELAAPGCTGTALIALTVDEYAAYTASPLNLSIEDGMTISWLVIGVWAVALLARALYRAMKVADSGPIEGS